MAITEEEMKPTRINKPAFELAVNIKMNIDLAFALADFILDNKCNNPAILAIGHQIIGNQPRNSDRS